MTSWLRTLRQYVLSVTLLNFLWEILQLPLYTLWSSKNNRDILFAVLHCTAGDLMIAVLCLMLSLLLAGSPEWPYHRFKAVALSTILFGVGYTIYSEWHNITVTHAWAYAAEMPVLFGIGLAPLAQWIVIPSVIFWRIRPH
jgi:hypothetical protein